MSEQADATITEQDGIITVTFDRQGKLNAINTQMSEALWEAANALLVRSGIEDGAVHALDLPAGVERVVNAVGVAYVGDGRRRGRPDRPHEGRELRAPPAEVAHGWEEGEHAHSSGFVSCTFGEIAIAPE